jgi:hypothetical protein
MDIQEQTQAILREQISVVIQDVVTDPEIPKEEKKNVIVERIFELYEEIREKFREPDSVEVKLPTADSPDLEVYVRQRFFDT